MTSADVAITRLAAGELDVLEPLWSALREHHGAIAPQFGRVRERADSWTVRRGLYEDWLTREGTFALLAHVDDELVGYAMVVVNGPWGTWPVDTSGCLETLSVLPSARGHGVGGSLITQARAGLAAQGVTNMTIDVITGNDDALRFYARHGFAPAVVSLVGPTTPAE